MMKKKLDEFVEKAQVNYDLPGLAVGVGIYEGSEMGNVQFSYKKVVGYKDWETKEPLLEDDIFHMASVTKLFVGTSIMQLCEKGKIDLEGTILDYLPWFTMADDRYKNITIGQMMSHTSGMPDVKDYCWHSPEIDEGALERYVRSELVSKEHLLWSPEEAKFAYSNIAYETLGVIIAEVSGMPFEEYVDKNILQPLEMEDSTLLTYERGIYNKEEGPDKNLCTPHEKDSEKNIVKVAHFPYNRAHGPSSTLTSNLVDMEKWAIANIKKTILKPETYDIMWTSQALVPNNGEDMCLSWFKREQNGFDLYGHEGTDDGFRSSFWICPERQLAITV
jgi:CubicO group peptidase (beta-lactamase class C family)